VLSPEVRRSYEACEALTRARAQNFYWGLRLTPEPRRSALYALYAWMRRADDLADDAPSRASAVSALRSFRDATDQALRGLAPRPEQPSDVEAFWPAFTHAAGTYALDPSWFADVFEGLLRDQDDRPVATGDELRRYCHCVAGTVGMMCVAVWGVRPGVDRAGALALADVRGLAFQVTNILRDVRRDASGPQPRVYLPESWLREQGLTIDALLQWRDARACAALIERALREASDAYARSAPLDAMVDPDCRASLWAMTRIYRGIFDRLRRDPRRAVGPEPARVPTPAKVFIMLRAGAGLLPRPEPAARAEAAGA
jgi:phytoene synthase